MAGPAGLHLSPAAVVPCADALSVHGVPRATVDLDIWIDRSPDNVKRVWSALVAFGAPLDPG
jgi:hypothetical protein